MFIREDKETGEKETISLDDLKFRLMGNYKDVDMAVKAIMDGETLQTNFNLYYLTPEAR